jgi:hypothetical protein
LIGTPEIATEIGNRWRAIVERWRRPVFFRDIRQHNGPAELADRFACTVPASTTAMLRPCRFASRVYWRWQCPAFLRQTFVEWAAQTINKFFWAGAYYHQQRAKGSSHQAAVRGLALKWIRILYRCRQTHTAYDESTYLSALKRRGSSLLKQFEVTT